MYNFDSLYIIKLNKDKDTFIMRTFCNVPIGTNLYKSTSEMRTPLY